MKKLIYFALFVVTGITILLAPAFSSLNLNKLSLTEQKQVDSILTKTESKIANLKSQGRNPNELELYDLKSGLLWKERLLIGKILRLKPADLNVKTPKQEIEQLPPVSYKTIIDQPVMKDGKLVEILPPAVSIPTYEAYETMMVAMKKEIGKKLYIESGHRSRGYHLYNFLKYLREHDYSLIETGKLNALPGYSEHNLLIYHAIDLINAEGINGEPKVEDYENLPEHQWMLKHASEYGFSLSYPRNNPIGISFEPWHWRVTAASAPGLLPQQKNQDA